MKFMIFIVVAIQFAGPTEARSIFKKNDTVKFYQVITDFPKDIESKPGCYFDQTPKGISIYSCDTIKPKRLICLLKRNKIFWHENPLDSFNTADDIRYQPTLPYPIFKIKRNKKKAYYCFKRNKSKELQFCLTNDTTFKTAELGIEHHTSSLLYFSLYKKDSEVCINNNKISCYLFYCRELKPNSDGWLFEHYICFEKSSCLPIWTKSIESEIFYVGENYDEKVQVKRESLIFLSL